MIKHIGLPLRGRSILLISRMITDRIGLHSVLLPLRNKWVQEPIKFDGLLMGVCPEVIINATAN